MHRLERRIDLWCVHLDQIADLALWNAYRDLLSPEETGREQRFTHDEPRRQFLAGRALLRTALSQYTGVDPRRLEFQCNRYGKPALKTMDDPPLEFSLSHTRGLVVCAVAMNDAVGVDVEGDRPDLAPLEVARRFFAPAEAAWLAELPPEEQRAAFFELWTLKEAFVKARGVGMAMPLADFSFSLSGDGSATIAFARPGDERPGNWQFRRFRLAADYQLALAVRRPAAQRSEIMIREAVPRFV